ncbi:MAG: rod shape-determining protein RodA [Treponema sp.]|jgi:rod shape determining protein RodA|nr:rod shape-determining protein RodA [Treponema sp.]
MRVKDILDIDFFILLPVMGLLVLGILFIYSSGITSSGSLVSSEYIRQIVWASTGLLLVFGLALVNYRRFYDFSLYLYLFILVPLLYTCIFGRMVHGTRWLKIGMFNIQASEFAKIATIIFLARYLTDTRLTGNSFIRFITSCLIVLVPMGIILVQPDLGTSLVFIPILLSMTFIAGISIRYVIFLVSCIALTGLMLVLPFWQTYILRKSLPGIVVLTNPHIIAIVVIVLCAIAAIALFGFLKYHKRYFYWMLYVVAIVVFSLGASYAGRGVLKNYQIMRLIVFVDPQVDPRGAGWNIIQSKTAIGAGGLTGQGYLQGTQSHYRFLPEQSTDFIFSIFSEEMGFIGGIIVFTLFLLICIRLLRITKTAADPFAVYICAGLVGVYSFHFFVNVGMTMGIMPITGIPLLFMSYGGSSVMAGMIGIGLAMSIHVRRYTHQGI